MSAEDENPELNDEESSNKAKKSAKYDSGAADLEKVTDYVEEAEISPQNIGEAIRVANDENNAKNVAKKEKEKELSKVKITKEDVDLIAKDAVFTTVKPLVHGTVSLLQKLREQPGENLQKAPELIESLSELNSRIRQPTEKQLDDFSTQIYRPFVSQLIENIENRFPDLPIIEKFDVFTARDIPDETEGYGDEEIKVHEMEIPRTLAERKLREHKGNIVEALVALTN